MNAPGQVALAGLLGRFEPAQFDPGGLTRRGASSTLELPGLSLHAGARGVQWNGRHVVAALGSTRFANWSAERAARDGGAAAGWLSLAAQFGFECVHHVSGPFAAALIDIESRTLMLCVDRFAIEPLCYRAGLGVIEFSERADTLAGALLPQAVFDYFYAHVIPAPLTVFEGVERLPGAGRALFSGAGLVRDVHWRPRFDARHHAPTEELVGEFRALLRRAVRREIDGTRVGCFLSGGTDSSTVVGMASSILGARLPTYSIGFDVPGYDEMAYARIAAAHFDCAHHVHYLRADDLVEMIPLLAAHCPQPFGNSSLAPAFMCARLAGAHGTEKLLAGDGGDELFGGNSRYAQQKLFEVWSRVPGWAQRSVEASLRFVPRGRLADKARAYISQAKTPLPERLDRYNLVSYLGPTWLFAPGFLHRVSFEAARARRRETWAGAGASHPLDAMLAFDWQTTLADNDLPKVNQACSAARVAVGFPLLDSDIADFALTLAPSLKVRGLSLRYFFKAALRDFLPSEILRKKKQGFGLPFGPWVMQHAGLRAMVDEAAGALVARGILREDFVRDFSDNLLARSPGYFGELAWLMLMLEHWLRAHAPVWRATD